MQRCTLGEKEKQKKRGRRNRKDEKQMKEDNAFEDSRKESKEMVMKAQGREDQD